MKKNSASLFLAAFATLFMLSSCQTFKVNVSEEPVFVIASVHANPNLPWKIATSDLRSDYNEDTVGNGSLINNQINKIFNKDDPELLGAQNRCDYIPEALERYFKQAGVKYVEHSVLMETEIFKNTETSFMGKMENELPATDYKNWPHGDKKLAKAIAEQTGADYLIYIDGYFQKEKVRNSALDLSAQADATLQITVLDKTGKMVMTKRYNCDSSSTIKAKRSKYDHNDMNDLFPSAIDHCISSFVSDIVVNDIGQEIIDSAAEDMELYGEEGTTITLPSAKPESDNTEAE